MLTVLTGRSRRLWPRVLEEIGLAREQGEKRLLLITPDQYTLQAELDLVDKLNLPGLLEIEVLSPSRLLTRVFSLAGSPQRVRVDVRGKAMMLSDVVHTSREALVYYGGAAGRRGFADRLSASIGDFKRAGRTPEDMRLKAGTLAEREALRGKLEDIALLYERYEQRLEGAFIDGEDAQEALLERLPASGLLQGAHVWVFGFDLITPQFMRQLAVMARGAESVRLALTCENEHARDGVVFEPVRDAIAMLARHFDRERLLWAREHVVLPLASTPEIEYLEQELYAMPPVPWQGRTECIRLRVAANPYDETMQAAAEMLRLAREGMPFDAMAVVIGDVEGYAGAVETSFGRSGIPYHITRKRPALAHPLVRAWLAALRTVTTQWRRPEDVLDWLKGGFSGLTVEENERLENYAIEHGLRGRKWRRAIEDAELEDIRQRFVAPLEALQARLRDAKDNTGSLSAIYQLLEDVDAYGTLGAWQKTLTERGLLTEAAECVQAWRLILEALDQLHVLLRGSRLRMDGLADVVESGFAETELGAVPPTPGIVQVGQLGHAKIGGECRVLFLLGMQDGIMQADTTSLISDAEAVRLTGDGERDGAFGMRSDTLAQLMQINLLDTLSAPTERLYISHAVAGAGGEAQRPAPVLKLLRKVFPGLVEEGSAIARESVVYHAPGAALDAMGGMLRTAAARDGRLTQAEAETAAWLLHAPQTREKAERVLRAMTMPAPPQKLAGRAADRLYAHTRTSVTRLESFANCPFRHFVTYGLRPVPRREFEVACNETGTFYHRAMEGYTKASASLPAWPNLTREENDRVMDAVLEPLREEWANTPLADNAMLQATGEAFCRIARRAAWNYAVQTKRGAFRTGEIEARFGPGEALPPIKLTLPDGRVCWVEGRIDRIDYFEEDGEKWLRVVDYKSGGTTLEPSRMYGGLQMQLLLYLAAALTAHPDIMAAGAFYSRFDDPYVETDSRDVETIETLIAEKLRLKGIMLSDVRIVRAMDNEKLITKAGTVSKKTDILTTDEMDALMEHAWQMASQMADGIASGEIAARPAQLEHWRACAWCDYHSVCGFDPALEGYAPRAIEKLTKKEMMQRLGVVAEE